MAKTVVAPHEPFEDHLERIKSIMKEKGSPVLRAFVDGTLIRLLEGSHRVAAAKELGYPIRIKHLDLEDEIDHDFEDIEDNPATVEQILNYLENPRSIYDFEDEEVEELSGDLESILSTIASRRKEEESEHPATKMIEDIRAKELNLGDVFSGK